MRIHGSVTSVRTSTFAGGNAYNSFSTFSDAQGKTVNLYVPKNANNLVNIVRSGPVNIQGTLNSFKKGRIGGNVVFADSYGFVVGKSGVLNVGGLTVAMPSGATLDQIVDKNGRVNQALAAQMIAGDVPLSADGSVIIKGRINSANFVRITAQDVRVAGSMAEAKRVAMHLRAGTLNADSSTYAAGAITLDASAASNGAIDLAGQTSGGATAFLAGASIKLEHTSVLGTRALDPTGTVSTTDTQNVSLTAPTINALAGSQITAGVINTADTGFLAGTISFDATAVANGTITAARSLRTLRQSILVAAGR